MLNILQNNRQAIYELKNGNEAIARDLFRMNVIKAPSCVTLNNLGVYYSQYGMLLKSGKVRSAQKIGLKYLIGACAYGNDWRNYVSVATAVSEYDDIQTAYEFFVKAYELKKDTSILYDIGACLYKLQKYKDAASVFVSLCSKDDIEHIINDGGQNPLIVLAYCQDKLKNKQKCIEYINTYRNSWKTDELLDVFCLRYLCGMYDEALAECDDLLKEWYPTDSLLAMIADCMDKASYYRKNIIIPYQKLKRWNLLRHNLELRIQKIQEYSFTPSLICMYQFIDI